MFAACKPLKAKVEAMEEFASVPWSIQAKVEICWSVAWSVAWILPQAHKAHQAQSGHRNWPNTSCIRNPNSQLYKVIYIYIYIYMLYDMQKNIIRDNS